MRLRGKYAGPEILGRIGPEQDLLIGSEGALPVPAATIYNWLNGPSQDCPTDLHIALRDI